MDEYYEYITQEQCNDIADHLEAFIDNMNLFILEGRRQKDIEHSEKVIRKTIKNLRKGKLDKVFDLGRLEEYNDHKKEFDY